MIWRIDRKIISLIIRRYFLNKSFQRRYKKYLLKENLFIHLKV